MGSVKRNGAWAYDGAVSNGEVFCITNGQNSSKINLETSLVQQKKRRQKAWAAGHSVCKQADRMLEQALGVLQLVAGPLIYSGCSISSERKSYLCKSGVYHGRLEYWYCGWLVIFIHSVWFRNTGGITYLSLGPFLRFVWLLHPIMPDVLHLWSASLINKRKSCETSENCCLLPALLI